MTTARFTVGAAMPASQLDAHRDWLIDKQRDLEIQDPVYTDIFDGDWRALAQQVKRSLSGYTGRLGVHGPFEGLSLMSFDKRVQQLASERLLQGLDFAEEVGATHMVVHSPWLTLGHHFVPTSPYDATADLIKRAHATLEAPLKRAERVRCALVIENIFDLHTEPWMMLVRSFDSDYVRASIDIGHAFCMQRGGGAPPDAFVRAAGGYLAHVHLQDTDGLSDRHWAPGDGDVNFFALFGALNALEQTPRLILELHDYDRIAAGFTHLAALGLVN